VAKSKDPIWNANAALVPMGIQVQRTGKNKKTGKSTYTFYRYNEMGGLGVVVGRATGMDKVFKWIKRRENGQ
jgi:hypothetical protein